MTRPTQLGRRTLLVAGAGTVAACSTDVAGTPEQARSLAPGTGPGRGAWARLARRVRGPLRRPGSPGYDTVRLVENPRYDDNDPLAVLTVADATDVVTALAFAQHHGVPVAIRSGGHSYPGWSAGGAPGTGMPRALVLDCRSLDRVHLRSDGSVTIGAGAALAPVYDALGTRDRAIPGGSCATVGLGGLALGGGVGVLTRAMGLTCDAVTALQVVTADGRVRHVDADHDDDLYWALRGCGGGHLGVVTSFTLATRPAPTLSTFYLQWPVSQARQVISAWQDWAPHADHRLWSTLKVLGGGAHPGGPIALVSGTWTGPSARLDHQLAALDAPPPAVRTSHVRSYRDAMMSFAGCATIPVSRCHTGPGGSLSREAFAATSHVGYAALDHGGISDLLHQVHLAQGSGLHEAGISMDALGGRAADPAPDATAFVHRQALVTVQYTATYAGHRARAASSYVRGFRSAMLPHWGNHAYVNYADQAVHDHRHAYFGANAARLATVRRTYDPDTFFAQPQGF